MYWIPDRKLRMIAKTFKTIMGRMEENDKKKRKLEGTGENKLEERKET